MSSSVELAYFYKNLVIKKVPGGTFDKKLTKPPSIIK